MRIVVNLLVYGAAATAQSFTTRKPIPHSSVRKEGFYFSTGTWQESVQLASQLVGSLSLSEKVGVVTGQGQFTAPCIGNTHGVNRSLPNAPNGLPAICLNDGPSGVRAVDWVTGFPPGINAASTYAICSFYFDTLRPSFVIIPGLADDSSRLVERPWQKNSVEKE